MHGPPGPVGNHSRHDEREQDGAQQHPSRPCPATVDRAPNVEVRLRRSPGETEGGRGLFLVEHLSSGWGSVSTESGKTVWFELQA